MFRKNLEESQPDLFGSDDATLNKDRNLNGALGYEKKLPAARSIYVVDFFAGCGGMSSGFASTRQSHQAFEVLLGVDIDEKALGTYAANVDAPTLCCDIREIAKSPSILTDALGGVDLAKLRPLVFIGCPPCQGFSAHRRKDERDDPRNDLAISFAKLCEQFRPDVVVMENVKEILQGKFAKYFSKAAKVLESAGYNLTTDVLDLSHFGVPQRRHRAVVLGALKNSIKLPAPILNDDEVVTVRQAIAHLSPLKSGESDPEDPHHRAPKHIPRILELINKIPKDGGDRRHLGNSDQLNCHVRVDNGNTPGFTDVYGRLRWDTPSVTITAKSSTPSCGRFLHPEQNRNITVREAAILQGFPQSFHFEGPFANQYRQIGEAVPPLFARSLAWSVLDHFCSAKKVPQLSGKGRQRPKRSKSDKTQLRLVDAFCGAGGLSLGFQGAGFKSTLAFDLDTDAVQTFRKNFGDHGIVLDVQSSKAVSALSKKIDGQPWVMVGGPPCQGFSQQRRGQHTDSRNNLVTSYVDLCLRMPRLPEALVLENVTYLDSPRGKHILAKTIADLESAGYEVFRHDLNSADYGVAQLRRRIIIVALRKEFAMHYHGPKPLTKNRWMTVGECLAGLPDPLLSESTDLGNHLPTAEREPNRQRIAFVDMGKGRLAIPESLQLPCHRKYGGHLDVYGRLDWFSQARTITGGFDSFTRGEYGHPFGHRSITAREAARIQGFPDWFSFEGKRASVRQQIGNAVPPPMAFAVAKGIIKALSSE